LPQSGKIFIAVIWEKVQAPEEWYVSRYALYLSY